MSKSQLNSVYGLERFFIAVDNKWIYDDHDDYASRTYLYGNISFTISEDARFTIYPDGHVEILNFSLVIHGGADFDWVSSDEITNGGGVILERAIDPSRIGNTVEFDFDAATPYTYTQSSFNADVARVDGFSTVLNPFSISQAMGRIIQELYDEGTIKSVMDGKLILYGSDAADDIGPYTSRIGINVSDPGLDVPNPLAEHTDGGLIYVSGAGSDTITGTSSNDVLFGGDGSDHLFGRGGDDFIFFDAADDTSNINGGAGRDAAYAVTNTAITANMGDMAMEILVGGGGDDAITLSGSGERMAAGGAGADTFNITYGSGQDTRVVWGGAGADVCNFNDTGDQSQLGILVAKVAGLTAALTSRSIYIDACPRAVKSVGVGGLMMTLAAPARLTRGT